MGTAAQGDGATAGVVLAGGRSARMGTPKAGLAWAGSTLLHRTVELLTEAVEGPVVVVRAEGQQLPALPPSVRVVADPVADLGPMQGIAAGLAEVASAAPNADLAFVCATDLPFLHPTFVAAVLRCLRGSQAELALPVIDGRAQPLAAAYRVALAPTLQRLVEQGVLRLGQLPEHCVTVRLDERALLSDGELARRDPRLRSVVNVNTPRDYAAARRQADARRRTDGDAPCRGDAGGVG